MALKSPPHLCKHSTDLLSSIQLFLLPIRLQRTHPISTTLHNQSRNISSVRRHLRRPLRLDSRHNSPAATQLPPLTATPAGAYARKIAADTLPLRTGAIATKKGMTSMFDTLTGARIPCTVLQMDRVQVVAVKTRQRHGYDAVVVGAGWRHWSNVGKAMLGVFARAGAVGEEIGVGSALEEVEGVSPKRWMKEFRVRDRAGLLPVGTLLGASWFRQGQFVDTRSKTRGMGFAGGMKRHGFSGQPASHGTSLTHRAMGSAGPSQGGGSRVHPGKKMAGNMGGQRHTIQNLKVMHVDEESGIVVVNGCVSGPKGCLVKIQDAIKKPWPEMQALSPPAEPLIQSATT